MFSDTTDIVISIRETIYTWEWNVHWGRRSMSMECFRITNKF